MASNSEIRFLTPLSIDTGSKKKYCRFKKTGIKYIDYKDADFLTKFLNEQGKILPRRITGTSLKFQRKVKTHLNCCGIRFQKTNKIHILLIFIYC